MANYVYGLPKDHPSPPPYALGIALDWREFHTPPYAGGLYEQPIQLLKEIRFSLNAYEAIKTWRTAQHTLNGDAFQKFCSANQPLVKFMTENVLFATDEDNLESP